MRRVVAIARLVMPLLPGMAGAVAIVEMRAVTGSDGSAIIGPAMMNRRRFLRAVSAGLLAAPVTAEAQPAATPVVGILNMQTLDTEMPRLTALRQGLKQAGFVEGQTVALESRFAHGHVDRLPGLAAELVRLRVSVIMANTTPPATAAKAATSTIPIVFAFGADPVELGLVASFNRPGGNITGIAFLVNKLIGKRLELLAAVVPKSAPIGMLYDPNNLNSAGDVRDAQAAAAALGRNLIVAKVATESELDTAITGLVQQRIGALFIAPNANFRIWRDRLLALAARHGLPASYPASEFVKIGGLMAYGPNQADIYRQAGLYVGRILKGEKPAEMPIAQPTKFEFIINLKTAKALGLALPPSLLLQADQIIE